MMRDASTAFLSSVSTCCWFNVSFSFCRQLPGRTLLTYAAEKGQVAIVDRLLLAGADIKAKDKVIDSLEFDGLWSTYTIFAYIQYDGIV